MKFWPAATLDTIAITTFAVVGRRSHAEAADLAGVLQTAWPFLAGAALGTLLGRAWRRPAALGTGAMVWACTVAGGMTLRAFTGRGVQPSFVVVASVVLAILLVGWRAGYALIVRARVRHERSLV